ncbi:MAG: site-specific DNA-methyltransferase [Elusimicrobiota bacterium]|nr:MAG: site-specific DNA-methyltransferase [Elusimicrobiota bacterium]
MVNHHRQVPFRLLRDVPALSCGDPGSGNLIVQGDNLLALKALLPYYAGQVKCIYIDPPYNTGNEGWIYNDNTNSPVIKKWLGEVVGKEGETLDRHDRWLCMMYPRLALLKRFLRKDGAIFVSIDDNEYDLLKMLMGDIFGPENHVGTFIWKRRTTPDSRNLNGVSGDHEYVLCFQRSPEFRVKGQEKDLGKYTNPDNDPRGPWMSDNLTGLANAKERPNLHYDIIHPITGARYKPHPSRGWGYGQERMAEAIKNDRILWPKRENGRPRLKRFMSDMQSQTTGFSTVLNAPGNVEATKELHDLLGPKAFAFPKPTRLVEILISQATGPNDLVLDSFAGSGTTGHAVLSLNKQDGGNRKFLIIEMDRGIAESITAKRIRHAAVGHIDSKGEAVPGIGGEFRFCELGEPLFEDSGRIRPSVTFADLARHVYFTETGEPLPKERIGKSPFLGECRGVGIYLLYNGILGDKSAAGGNVLTRQVLNALPPFKGQKIIYCAGNLLGKERLDAQRIIVRQTPYEIKVA